MIDTKRDAARDSRASGGFWKSVSEVLKYHGISCRRSRSTPRWFQRIVVPLLSYGLGASVHAASGGVWVGSRYAAPVEFAPQFANATLRTVVHLTAGGDRLRLRFSNQFGRTPLKIGMVYVAEGSAGRKVTFNGKSEVTLSAGGTAFSDPVNMRAAAGAELAISAFYPEAIPNAITMHFVGDSVNESSTLTPGNAAHGGLVTTATPIGATYFLIGVDVEGADSRGTIVAIGDSITDGGAGRWPAFLAKRLSESGKNFGVLNAGIAGNRLLNGSGDGWGELGGQSALSRFDYDVLGQPGVRYVILYEGINDLGMGKKEIGDGSSPPVVADIVVAVRRLYERAHQHGLKMYVATLPPFEGAVSQIPGYYSPEKNRVRTEFNEWIRTTQDMDGYFDFDRALADPARPNRMNLAFDSGDHLHPNDAGERALSEAINLSSFE